MARERKKRADPVDPARAQTQPPKARSKAAVEFLSHEHAAMFVVRGFEEQKDWLGKLGGAYVKFAPTIRASERAAVDSKGVRDRLLKAGAAAVVVAPVVIPDNRIAVDEPGSLKTESPKNAEEYLRAWFATASAPADVIRDAISEALSSVGEAGL